LKARRIISFFGDINSNAFTILVVLPEPATADTRILFSVF
jgi:hypothetical protein